MPRAKDLALLASGLRVRRHELNEFLTSQANLSLKPCEEFTAAGERQSANMGWLGLTGNMRFFVSPPVWSPVRSPNVDRAGCECLPPDHICGVILDGYALGYTAALVACTKRVTNRRCGNGIACLNLIDSG